MNETKYKAIIVFMMFLIALPIGLSIRTIGEYGEEHIISSEHYTARLHTGENLEVYSEHPITINNKFRSDIVPTVTIDGNPYRLVPVEDHELILESEKSEYHLEFMGEIDDVETTKELYIKEDRIVLKSTIENIGRENKEVETTYELESLVDSSIFYPGAVEEEYNNYVILTNPDYKGNSLGVITNINLDNEEPFMGFSEKEITRSAELSPGEEISLEVTFKPVNIWTEENQLDFPHEYSVFLENPLVGTIGDLDITLQGENPSQKIIEMLSIVSEKEQSTTEGFFNNFEDVDLNTDRLNSLEASVIYKEICIQENIPCRIIVGEDERERNFAWIRVLENGEWEDINPFTGTRSSPGYTKKYQEPNPMYIEIPGDTINEENYLESTKIILRERINPLIYLGISIASTLIIMSFIFLKSDYLVQILTEEKSECEIAMNGKCKILDDKDGSEDETCVQILEKIKEEDGEINVKKYSEDMGYSEDLIRHYLQYLDEEGIIELEKKNKPEKLEIEDKTSKSNIFSQINTGFSKTAERINLTPKQLMLILLTIVIGIIAMSAVIMI